MKFLLILLLATEVFSQKDSTTFEEWQSRHRISFRNDVERRYRKRIFDSNLAEINKHNANPRKSYTKVLNEFSHLNSDEFIKSHCMTVLPEDLMELAGSNTTGIDEAASDTPVLTASTTYPFGSYTPTTAPASRNFASYVQPVQNQASCGSCWAFAATAQLEAMMKIRNSNYATVLSPQYLVDCDKNDGGCNGGWPTTAMKWIALSGGNAAPSMSAYPYTAVQGTCKSVTKIALGITTITENYMAGDEGKLKAQVANYGPQVVAITATWNFQSYHNGVLYDSSCPSSCGSVNHAVTVVGYGTDSSLGDYWLVKNSWGTGWGEAGYIRMARNKNNNCNIACWGIFAK